MTMKNKIYFNNFLHVKQLCDIDNETNDYCKRLYNIIFDVVPVEEDRAFPTVLDRMKHIAKFSVLYRPEGFL